MLTLANEQKHSKHPTLGLLQRAASNPDQVAQKLPQPFRVHVFIDVGSKNATTSRGPTTRSKKLLGAPGIATRSKDATN